MQHDDGFMWHRDNSPIAGGNVRRAFGNVRDNPHGIPRHLAIFPNDRNGVPRDLDEVCNDSVGSPRDFAAACEDSSGIRLRLTS